MTFLKSFLPALSDRQCRVLLTLITLAWFGLVVQLQKDWWFEDDPNIIHFVRSYPNPLDYFFNRDAWLVLSPSRILTPIQPLSFKLDAMAGGSPLIHYGHAGLVLLITILLGYSLLRRIMSSNAGLVTMTLWLLTPSTPAVLEFLAARHYLEGMAFCLLSLHAALHAIKQKKRQALPWVLASMAAWMLAALSKELYVTTGFWLLFMMYVSARRYITAAACMLPVIVYFAYRIWMIGLVGQGFDHSLAFVTQYHRFLGELPFIVTGHRAGYILAAALLPAAFHALRNLWRNWRDQRDDRPKRLWQLVFWSGNTAIALATIFPVSASLYDHIQDLGPWYRVAFVLNPLLLTGAAVLVCQWRADFKIAMAAASLIIMSLGAWNTAVGWDLRKAHYTSDGQFYRDHPNKLLYSTLPAFYLSGIHNMYHGDHKRNFITSNDLTEEAFSLLTRNQEVWYNAGDGHRIHPQLHRTLTLNLTNQTIPLHQPVIQSNHEPSPPTTGIDYKKGQIHIYRTLHGAKRGGPMTLALHNQPAYLLLDPIRQLQNKQLLLANDSNTKTSLDLIFTQAKMQILKRSIVIQAGSSQSIPLDAPIGSNLLEIRAKQPFRGGLTATSIAGEPLFFQAVPSSSTPKRYIAHIPNPKVWSTNLLVRSVGQDPVKGTLSLYNKRGEVKQIELSEQGVELSHINDFEAVAGVINLSGSNICILAYETRDGQQLAMLEPASEAAKSFNMADLPGIEGYQNLALFNPNRQYLEVTLTGNDGAPVLNRHVPPRTRLPFSHKLGTRGLKMLQANQDFVALTIFHTPWGQYHMTHPPPETK